MSSRASWHLVLRAKGSVRCFGRLSLSAPQPLGLRRAAAALRIRSFHSSRTLEEDRTRSISLPSSLDEPAYPPLPKGFEVTKDFALEDDDLNFGPSYSHDALSALRAAVSESSTEKGHIANYYSGKTVLMLGCSGFVGKCVLEKMLRDLPELKAMYVMVRAKKVRDPTTRFREEIAPSKALERLRLQVGEWDSFLDEKVVAVGGDIASEGLGLSAKDMEMITKNVDVIINCAASIDFATRLDQIMNTNTKGPMRVLNLAKSCEKAVTLVHMSTAYVGSHNPSGSRVMETLPKTNIDPEDLIEKLKTMSVKEVEKKTPDWIGNHQNTYTFSKALGETMIERHHDSIPTAIVRPSIIVNSRCDPMPGWIENLSGAAAVAFYSHLGRCPVVQGSRDSTFDVIPVDYVVNTTIAAAWQVAQLEGKQFRIYHSASSTLNPMTPGRAADQVVEFQKKFPSRKAFFKPEIQIVPDYWSFKRIQIAKTLSWCFGALLDGKPIGKTIEATLKAYFTTNVIRGFFIYFASNEWFYDASNVLDLDKNLLEADRKVFPVDCSKFVWEDYFEDFNAGLLEFVLKEGDIQERRKAYYAGAEKAENDGTGGMGTFQGQS